MTFNTLDKNGFIFAVSTLWGKITDKFDGLAKVAKSGNYIDLTNKPDIPSGANNLTTTEEGMYLDATQGKILNDEIAELNRNMIDASAPLITGWSVAEDCNNVKSCIVMCNSNTQNSPYKQGIQGIGNSGVVISLNTSPTWNRQICFTLSSNSLISRYCNNGVWSSWTQV